MADEIKTTAAEAPESRNFIHAFIEEDIAPGGQFEGMTVHTRFPPEPNGYLHIGHCKALTIDFGTAEKFGGLCNLRMDDTNPTKEDEEFVEAIKEDIHWLGFDWGDRFFYGSDYFEEDYRQAVGLIKKGLAYVCELSPEEFRAHRGDIGDGSAVSYQSVAKFAVLYIRAIAEQGQVMQTTFAKAKEQAGSAAPSKVPADQAPQATTGNEAKPASGIRETVVSQ